MKNKAIDNKNISVSSATPMSPAVYVLKIGGSTLHEPDVSIPLIAATLCELKKQVPDCQVAIVHGGGHHIHNALKVAKLKSHVIDGYRVTPKEHIPFVEKVLFCELYQQLYTHFSEVGLKVSKWSTASEIPATATQKKGPCGTPFWAYVGDELQWQVDTLKSKLQSGEVLLLPSLAPAISDDSKELEHNQPSLLNINADDMARSLAIALRADALIYLTDVDGVLDQFNNRLAHLTPDVAQIHIEKGHLAGGMKIKVSQGFKALHSGVAKVLLCPIINLHKALKGEDCGTVLTHSPSPSHHHLMGTYQRKPLIFKEGYGPWIVTDDGTTYLDMVSGVAVNTLGHAHPKITETIEAQAGKLLHLSNLYYSAPQLKLAETLVALSGMHSVFLSNSGTEAVEAALKIARKFGKQNGGYKRKILHLSGSFHGRTFGALTVTSNVHYQAPFLPLVSETEEIPSGDITTLQRIMSEDVCAIILEPIQGESGVNLVDSAFISAARALCDQYNALLIFDEVQCGIGRTGTMFYYEQLGIQPDVLCLAKGLGGGFPIGATLVNQRADVLTPGDHGSTFGGNPLAASCANAILETIQTEELLPHVAKLGNHVLRHFKKYPHPLVEKVTGSGLFLGIHLTIPTKDVIDASQDLGMLLIGAGTSVVRLLPPLNITEDVLNLAIMRFYCALDRVMAKDTDKEIVSVC